METAPGCESWAVIRRSTIAEREEGFGCIILLTEVDIRPSERGPISSEPF